MIKYVMKKIILVIPLVLIVQLSSCGGDTTLVNGGGGGNNQSEYHLKNLVIGSKNLSAGGSTGITVELRNKKGEFVYEQQSVIFSSLCIAKGLSEIESPVTSDTGLFSTTYTSKGCEGSDKITVVFEDNRLRDTINIQASSLGSVEFVSADPQIIALQGFGASGLQHTSRIKFRIKNNVGGPIANTNVKFELTSSVGGARLSVTEAQTDKDGFVSTLLQAGSVHTSIRVRATVTKDNNTISTESSQLVISTGVADQNSLSLSLSVHNPLSWEYDGEKVNVTLFASDRYNNPAPDGTTVAFYSELGQIEPSCQLKSGSCSVMWTSSNPRDIQILDTRYPRSESTESSDGISTITAILIGEESFIDTNSNGIFDDGDIFDTASDKGEAYEDYNINYDVNKDGLIDNSFDDGLDPFIDFNGNAIHDDKDGKYTGLGCKHSSLCAKDNGLKNIFVSTELIMAEENLGVRIWESNYNNSLVNTVRNGVIYTLEVFGITNNQIPPDGTEITLSSQQAELVFGKETVGSTSKHLTVLNEPTGAYTIPFLFKDKDPSKQENGQIHIKITTPKGKTTTYFINYQDDPATTQS